MFLDDHYKKWIISEDFRIKDNEIDPTCKKRSLIKWYYAYYDLHNLELCNTTSGYKLVGVTSMTMSGKNCEERLKELVENENEYVFYSTSGWHNPRCQFAYFGEVKFIRSDSASLSVHHKRCSEVQKLNTSEVFSEENDTDAIKSQTLVFGLIGLSATVLVGLATFITVYCLKRKGIICISKKQKDEVIVHQNELYGNLSNQDYFEERYDTNILDRNQYYEEEYEA